MRYKMLHPIITALIIGSLTAHLAIALTPEQEMSFKRSEAMRELEEDELTLRFLNALTGEPVSDASVKIDGIGSYTTDHTGACYFSVFEDGEYTVRFSKTDYIDAVFTIDIMAGSIFANWFSVSPNLPPGKLRIVLDWGKDPADLDAHLVKPGDYHISYRKMKVASDGRANLDRDDVHSYGPETITVNRIEADARYQYYVHDYSNRSSGHSEKLAASHAVVKVYGDSKLLQTVRIPQNTSGNVWHVFAYQGGNLNVVNEIMRAKPW